MDFYRTENRLWYAVQTNSRHEQVVYDRLVRKNFEAFLPKIEVWSRRKDRKKRIEVPLFRGYLFINCKLHDDNWLNILKTPGLARIIGFSEGPTPIDEEEINSIKILLQNDTVINPYPFLKLKRQVRIVNGPLAGVEGVLLKTDENKNKLVVSVTLLQRSICVEVNSIDVEPIL
ncbi:MAG: transcription termination/antitermination protein NusG [bacterium]